MSEWGGHQVAPAGALAVALCRAIVAEFTDMPPWSDPMNDPNGYEDTVQRMVKRAREVVEVADKEERRG